MEPQRLIRRSQLGFPQQLAPDVFLSLCIDYRTEGNLEQQYQVLQDDFNTVACKVESTDDLFATMNTFDHYAELIGNNYSGYGRKDSILWHSKISRIAGC